MVIELPAGMALRYFHPRWVFGTAAIVFGVAAASAGKARNYATLMGLRVLIGLAEAFVNNAYIFVSLWYKHSELALRTGE
jgi:nitrate/nitrite transporter NarK